MAENELKTLQELSGAEHILKLFYSTQTRNNIYIVSQLCQKGSLADIIKQKGKLPEEEALKYLFHILKGY